MGDAIEPEAQPNAETGLDVAAVQARYAQEKAKRLHPEGVEQYVELTNSGRLQSLASDPWVDHDALNAEPPSLRNGDDIKVLILGAGYGGLLYAIHFIQQGISPSDIRLVDGAGGFGGTWYWNRFPGLQCDTEGYTALIGGAHDAPLAMEDVPAHIGALLALDAPRTDAIRRHVDDVVEDKATAAALKAWYPTWCKRPTFSDNYLATFNRPNVHLVDTDGRGVEKATATGLTGASANFSHVQNVLAEHCGYILGEAVRRAAARGLAADRVVVEATVEAEEAWAGRLMQRAAWFAGAGICAPNINNNEGSLGADPTSHMKIARGAPYALGMNAYAREIRSWQEEGTMKGVDVW
ncbi:hypothetical protein VdG1_08022 [Verticillium dahliae VDG1]|nr:hypothetical protein VdG1_08022 [Verticillium dahliae VDG1]